MSPLCKLFRQLESSVINQAVKVRVVRLYSLHVGDDTANVYSLECVLHDAEGRRIHASIRKQLIPKFVHMLREEHLYCIKNFILLPNNMKLKTTSFERKITFTPRTNAVEIFDPAFPRNIFDFKMYDDMVAWENCDESLLIDVIGRLSSRTTLQRREVLGRETNMLDITIMNIQGHLLKCTLWGDYAQELLSYVERNEGPIVIIIQLGRVRKFRGDIRVANTFNVTKVIFDENVLEIQEFQQGLVVEGNVNMAVTLATPNNLTLREELERSRARIISIDSLIRIQQIEHYWVLCQIVAIEPMLEWNYVSCTNCYKKMEPIGASFYCVYCDNSDPIGTLRYKVLVRVADSRGICSLILWDKECQYLIGETAEEVKAQSSGQVIPNALQRIIGFKGLFKVNVKDFGSGVNLGPFPVMKITCDMHLIAQFCDLRSLDDVGPRDIHVAESVVAPIKPTRVRNVDRNVCDGVKKDLMDDFNEAAEGEKRPSEKASNSGVKRKNDGDGRSSEYVPKSGN